MGIDILIIDDERDVRESIEEVLGFLKGQNGYNSLGEIKSVTSVNKAKEFLSQNTSYKLILLDNKIVGEPDGITQAKDLRESVQSNSLQKVYICLHTTYGLEELKKSQKEEKMPNDEFMKKYSLDRIIEKGSYLKTLRQPILEIIRHISAEKKYS